MDVSEYVDESIYTQANEPEADFYITDSDQTKYNQQIAQEDELEADFHINYGEYLKDREQRNTEAAEKSKNIVATR